MDDCYIYQFAGGSWRVLTAAEWLVVGVDLNPPPRDPHASPAHLFVERMDGWSDYREESALAKELAYIRAIGNMTEVLDL